MYNNVFVDLSQSSSRRDVCERRSAMARSDYIMSLAAANAHMTRYYCKEMQDIMSVSCLVFIKISYL